MYMNESPYTANDNQTMSLNKLNSSNLQTSFNQTATNLGYKQILLRKLSYAVICSVISQLIILLWYIFVLKFTLWSPIDSVKAYLHTLTSVGTWAYLTLFMTVVFAQSIICAKDYIMTPRYSSTRFSRLKAMLSLHNIVLMNLHILVGFISVWLYLSFTSYNLLVHKTEKQYYIVEDTLYLLYLAAWTGFHYFISVYTSEKRVHFPVIQQMKWLQFKAQLLSLLKQSKSAAFWPAVYFILMYALIGQYVNEVLPFEVQQQASNWWIYVLAWFFATLIYFLLNLMNFYYELFLTEPYSFPIVADSSEVYTLKDALESKIPIIQHLACQDLFLLSGSSPERRSVLFTLSSPGHHPHNWNSIIQVMLKILKEYSECLNGSLNTMITNEKVEVQKAAPIPEATPYVNKNVRRMGLSSNSEPVEVISFGSPNYIKSTKESIASGMNRRLEKMRASLKERLGINFLFKELPEASVQKCLGDGQMIVWISQAMSSLCSASLIEDRYGIVQKDLPLIISMLVELKLSVEKLYRLPALNRKPGNDDYNCRMKLGIMNAIKRSLYNIVASFEPYLQDLNLKADVIVHLPGFAMKHCYAQ